MILPVFCVALMLTAVIDPIITGWVEGSDPPYREYPIPGPYRNLNKLVTDLLEVTEDWTDSDNDTLPDSVERIIGTDIYNKDSDHDTLNDSYEVKMNMDPLSPDSNKDGLSDPREITNVSLDIDNDGTPNAWDRDNDNDGLEDRTDMSPFMKTDLHSSYHIGLNSTGKPLYLTFQIVPENTNNLKLMLQTLDWPLDTKGDMRDMDNSSDDIFAFPYLEMKCDRLPDQKDVIDYGIIIGEDVATVPLFSEWEYGKVVGLRGKIFIPGIEGRIDMDLALKWDISGLTDSPAKTLRGSNYLYLTSRDNNILYANSSTISEPQRFTWQESDGTITMVSESGNFIGIDDDGYLKAKWSEPCENCYFTLETATDGYCLRGQSGRYPCLQEDGSYRAEDVPNTNALMNVSDNGYRGQKIKLITYDERFTIASLIASENGGTEIGVFYSDNPSEMITANMVFSYDYLHNYSNPMENLDSLLLDRELELENILEEYPHQDLAVMNGMEWMIEEAIKSLPEDRILPVTVLMEDRSAMVDISRMNTTDGRVFFVDMASKRMVTTRTLKSAWYRTPSTEPLDANEIVDELLPLLEDLDEEEASMVISLALNWNFGDLNIVHDGWGVVQESTVIGNIHKVMDSILFLTSGKMIRWGFFKDILFPIFKFVYFVDKIFPSYHTGGTGLQKWKWAYSIYKDVKVLEGLSSAIEVLGWVVDIVGYVVDMGMVAFTFIAMCASYGWDPFGVTIAGSYAIISAAYISAMFLGSASMSILASLLGALTVPVVGWIIAGVAAVISLAIAAVEFVTKLLSGKTASEWVIGWIVDAFSGVRTLTSLDMEFVDSGIEIIDRTGNGIDAGDRIEYRNVMNSTVTRMRKGTSDQVNASYLIPEMMTYVPWLDSMHWENILIDYGYERRELFKAETGDMKKIQYENTGWVEPGIAMPNMPVVCQLNTHYKTFYQEYNHLMLYYDTKNSSGIQMGEKIVSYYDVLPETIEEFATWKYLKYADSDGDGMNDTDEIDTDPLKWDSDGDLLADSYEINLGYDPTDPDSDRDGLWDKWELLNDLDPAKYDTDGDGLSDYQEYEGWVINFTYCGKFFEWHIRSDPAKPDTDGDGLNDTVEFLCLLNPMSSDTDGDGMQDMITNYSTTKMEKTDALGDDEPFCFHDCNDLTTDSIGNIIMISQQNDSVIKMTPKGDLLWEFKDPSLNYLRSVVIGPEDRIYVGRFREYEDLQLLIFILNPNGTLNKTIYNLDQGFECQFGSQSLVVDDAGNIFSLGWGCGDPPVSYLVKYSPNGTTLNKKIFYQYSQEELDQANHFAMNKRGYYFILDSGNKRVAIYDDELNLSYYWGISQFGSASDIWIDEGDNIFICDGDQSYDLIAKFDRYRRTLAEWSTPLIETSIYVDPNGDILVGGVVETGTTRGRIIRFHQNVTIHQVQENLTFIDTDVDGLTDLVEERGWNVTVEFETGILNYKVYSNFKMVDSDLDGLSDWDEFNMSSNPNSTDTDGDGLPDLKEINQYTNLSSWDTDGDGLSDLAELFFISDPLSNDTDGDGLIDLKELQFGSDPNLKDSDFDGLDDLEEWDLGWKPVDPDCDGDFMFDGIEYSTGCDPGNPDLDMDGIEDGYERIFGTSPVNGDCDADMLMDGMEIDLHIDPLLNDTDFDGLIDSKEIEVGYNPLSSDSDGDGVIDGFDMDYTIDLEGDILVIAGQESDQFISSLSEISPVNLMESWEFLMDQSNADNIVVVGRPGDALDAYGKIICDLLKDRQDLLSDMIKFDESRCVVRYGVWKPDQTIVMLSDPYPNDHIRVLGILKSMRLAISQGAVVAEYQSPRNFIVLDQMDVVRTTDVEVSCRFDGNLTLRVKVNTSDVPSGAEPMSHGNGLRPDEVPMGKFVRIDIEDMNGRVLPDDSVNRSGLTVYYTEAELDVNGDGDSADPKDLDENKLFLYHYLDGKWNLLPPGEGINSVYLNTTDQNVHGREYAGYLKATLDHLSIIGIAGVTKEYEPYTLPVASAGDDITITRGDVVYLDGSGSTGGLDPLNFTWSFEYDGGSVLIYGMASSFVFQNPGVFEVILKVSDITGNSDTDRLVVIVLVSHFILEIGPVADRSGKKLPGAEVRISLLDLTLTNKTDGSGKATFVLPIIYNNSDVEITIINEGYRDTTYRTSIVDGYLVDSPPPLEKEKEEGSEWYVYLTIALLILILLVAAIYVIRRESKGDLPEE